MHHDRTFFSLLVVAGSLNTSGVVFDTFQTRREIDYRTDLLFKITEPFFQYGAYRWMFVNSILCCIHIFAALPMEIQYQLQKTEEARP